MQANPRSPGVEPVQADPQRDPRDAETVRAELGRSLGFAAWALALCFVLFHLLLLPYGRDQGAYALVGHAIAGGGVPYLDVWEQKTPGLYFLYALAELMFGREMFGIRVLEAVGLLAASLILVRFSRKFFDSELPALCGSLLAAQTYVQFGFWHTAQAEGFGFFFIVAATYLSLDVTTRRHPHAISFALGLIHGILFALKPNLAIAAVLSVGLIAQEILRRDDGGLVWPGRAQWIALLRHGAALAAGFVLVTGAWLGYVWSAAAFDAFLDSVVSFNLAHLRVHGAASFDTLRLSLERLVELTPPAVLLGVCCLLFFYVPKARPNRAVAIICAQIALQFLVVIVQGKLFNYHFSTLLPLMGVLAVWGFYGLWCASNRKAMLVVAAGALLMLRVPLVWDDYLVRTQLRHLATSEGELGLLFSRVIYRHGAHSLVDNLEAGAWISEHTAPEEKIFVWAFEPTLYLHAERESASRYVFNLPFRVSWAEDWRKRELLSELEANRPAVIVVSNQDQISWGTGNDLTSLDELASFPELARYIDRHYVLREQIAHLMLFRRVEPSVRLSSLGGRAGRAPVAVAPREELPR